MRNKLKILLLAAVLFAAAGNGRTQPKDLDVHIPIGKYILKGDAESLSAWFDDNLDISILSVGGVSSKIQAKQVMKTFFRNHKPEKFELTHSAGRANLKYILANLQAGGEPYHVIIFLNSKDGSYRIQQIKIDRML